MGALSSSLGRPRTSAVAVFRVVGAKSCDALRLQSGDAAHVPAETGRKKGLAGKARRHIRQLDQEIPGTVCPGLVHRAQAVATPQTVKGDGLCWQCRMATWN